MRGFHSLDRRLEGGNWSALTSVTVVSSRHEANRRCGLDDMVVYMEDADPAEPACRTGVHCRVRDNHRSPGTRGSCAELERPRLPGRSDTPESLRAKGAPPKQGLAASPRAGHSWGANAAFFRGREDRQMQGRPGRQSARALPLGVSGWEALSEDTWSFGKVPCLLEIALSTSTPSGEPSQENPPKPSHLRPRAVPRDDRPPCPLHLSQKKASEFLSTRIQSSQSRIDP